MDIESQLPKELLFSRSRLISIWLRWTMVLFGLSALYCSVEQVIEEADRSLPEIREMALETHGFVIQMAFEPCKAPPACKRLISTWASFIDSLMREWDTFRPILYIMIMFLIANTLQVAGDQLIRSIAFLSLMCALISFLIGYAYTVHFGRMQEPYKAVLWAQEAKRTQMCIWWNVRIMLAMPAIWVTWFMTLCIICFMLSVWRSGGTPTTPPGISDAGLLVIRIVTTLVLGIGMISGLLIIATFRRYSSAVMEEAWNFLIDKWIEERDQSRR